MFKKPWFIVLFANTMVVLLTLTITISIHLYNIYLRKPDPKPKITYSEFPISITYEIDGEVKKFEDVIICEYGGTKHVGLGVTHRIWNVKLKSGKKSPIIFYKVRKGNKTYNITKDIDCGEYYMGDDNTERYTREYLNKDIHYVDVYEDEKYVEYIPMTNDELYSNFKFRFIEINWPEPIINEIIED